MRNIYHVGGGGAENGGNAGKSGPSSIRDYSRKWNIESKRRREFEIQLKHRKDLIDFYSA
jgi:hypothetical protein